MQGCRAILLDKDKNPKVILTFCLLIPASWIIMLSIAYFITKVGHLLFLNFFLFGSFLFQWEPSRLEQINESMVEHYFSKIDDEEWEDLKLPAKFTFSASLLAKL